MPDIPFDPAGLAWDKQGGLLPAIVQHADTLQVLMLGYMDRAALAATLDTGRVTFFSRSRGRLWVKGERSGHHLLLEGVEADCDADTLLVQARPLGPTCHLDRRSCFPAAPSDFLAELDAVIDDRHRTRRPTATPPGCSAMVCGASRRRWARRASRPPSRLSPRTTARCWGRRPTCCSTCRSCCEHASCRWRTRSACCGTGTGTRRPVDRGGVHVASTIVG